MRWASVQEIEPLPFEEWLYKFFLLLAILHSVENAGLVQRRGEGLRLWYFGNFDRLNGCLSSSRLRECRGSACCFGRWLLLFLNLDGLVFLFNLCLRFLNLRSSFSLFWFDCDFCGLLSWCNLFLLWLRNCFTCNHLLNKSSSFLNRALLLLCRSRLKCSD